MPKDNNRNSVPTSLLIEWYNEEAAVFRNRRDTLNDMLGQSPTRPASTEDIERITGQVQERAEVLRSFAAFLVTASADEAGELTAILEEQ